MPYAVKRSASANAAAVKGIADLEKRRRIYNIRSKHDDKIEMRSGRDPGITQRSDSFALYHVLSLGYKNALHVRVTRPKSILVTEIHVKAISWIVPEFDDLPACTRNDR